MVTTIHTCAKCDSAEIGRNGYSNGHARYRCRACRYQAWFVPAAVAKAAQYAQVEALLVERNAQPSIARITGVARMTIARQLKKAAAASPPLPRLRPKKTQRKEWEILELDESWSLVGHKKRKVWLWLAVECARRRIVGWTLGWTLGCRGEAPLRQLWHALPQRVSPPLLVLHRPVESLRQSAAPLAAPALCQGRRPDQYRRSYQLPHCASVAACWCASPVPSANYWPCLPPELE